MIALSLQRGIKMMVADLPAVGFLAFDLLVADLQAVLMLAFDSLHDNPK